MSQILRIVLLGTNSIPKCNSIARTFRRKGLNVKQLPIDPSKPEHVELAAEASRSHIATTAEEPLICLVDADDNLTLVDGEDPMEIIQDLVEHDHRLQQDLVSVST